MESDPPFPLSLFMAWGKIQCYIKRHYHFESLYCKEIRPDLVGVTRFDVVKYMKYREITQIQYIYSQPFPIFSNRIPIIS